MLEYVQAKLVMYLISVVSCSINFGLVYVAIIAGVNGYSKLRLSRVILATVVTAIIYVTPQFIVEYALFYPEPTSAVLENFLLFPNPLYIIPYYFLINRVMKLPKAQARFCLEEIIYLQYIVLLLFRFYCGLWPMTLSHVPDYLSLIYYVDTLAMFSVFITSAIVAIVAVKTRKRRRNVPQNSIDLLSFYSRNSICKTIFGLTGTYLFVCLVGIYSLDTYRTQMNVDTALIYMMLIVACTLNLLDSIRKNKLIFLEISNFQTKEYASSLVQISHSLRGIRHDMNNILHVYGGYIALKDYDGLREYHESVVDSTTKVNEAHELILSLIHRKAVYSLLDVKLQRAQSDSIALTAERLDLLSCVKMSDFDLCRILGNLLDNAIDAAAKTEDKIVTVKCIKHGEGSVRLEIVNSVCTVALTELTEPEKSVHKGLGLSIVKSILAEYENCYMLSDCRNDWYYTFLTLQTD